MKPDTAFDRIETSPLLANTVASVLFGSLVRAAFGALAAGMLLFAGAYFLAPGFGFDAMATASLTGFASLALLVVPVARNLSRRLSAIASQPAELVLSHLMLEGEDLTRELNCLSGRRVTPDQIRGDLKTLEASFRNVGRRSRTLIEQLDLARGQADIENKSKTRFLASMSHELRTPLNAILGYTMLLREEADDRGDRRSAADLDRIEIAGRQLLSLINDILDLSRVATSEVAVERMVVELEPLLKQISSAFDAVPEHAGFELDIARDPNLPVMIGDAGKVKRSLRAMLDHAAANSDTDRIVLMVRARRAKGRRWIEFAVEGARNPPPGIDDAQLFEPFGDLRGPMDDAERMTDMGLPLAHRYAALMAGSLTATRTPGRGMRLTLTIPNGDGVTAGTEPEPVAGAADSDAGEGAPELTRTALLIDDSDSSNDLMCRWLTRMGFGVIVADNGETGIALAKRHSPDIVILDIFMPGLSGYEVLARLRAESDLADIPVIIVTVENERKRGLIAGATEYITKPLEERNLRELVELFDRRAEGTIMVVEDDEDTARLVSRSLWNAGYSTLRVHSAEDALERLESELPNAIVLDLTLPGSSGHEMIRMLAADPDLATVPVVVYSGADLSVGEHRAIIAAGYPLCVKGSHSPRDVVKIVRDIVS